MKLIKWFKGRLKPIIMFVGINIILIPVIVFIPYFVGNLAIINQSMLITWSIGFILTSVVGFLFFFLSLLMWFFWQIAKNLTEN